MYPRYNKATGRRARWLGGGGSVDLDAGRRLARTGRGPDQKRRGSEPIRIRNGADQNRRGSGAGLDQTPPERQQRHRNQLDVLLGERQTDDRDRQDRSVDQVQQRNLPTEEDQP